MRGRLARMQRCDLTSTRLSEERDTVRGRRARTQRCDLKSTGLSEERDTVRASRSHAAMRLEVNRLIGGERHGAGVSLACSDVTHHGSESITPSTAPQSRNFYRDQKHVLLST